LCSIKNQARTEPLKYGESLLPEETPKTLCLLFPIYGRFPKLNVAGSIPVSRSNQINSLRRLKIGVNPFEHQIHHKYFFQPMQGFESLLHR